MRSEFPGAMDLESGEMPSTFQPVKRLGSTPLHATEYRTSILSAKSRKDSL
jgi:hypothetical protein